MRVIALLTVALLAVGCGPKSKHELLTRTEKVKTKTELEQALGAPSRHDKLGPLEIWTYDASDGNVTFLITGEDVTLQATGQPSQ